MKISKNQLRQIIREAVSAMAEQSAYGDDLKVNKIKSTLSRTNPLGLGSAEGAMDTSTLKKGGTELNIGDEGYMDAFADVGMPGLPETGETEEEGRFVKSADVSALDETFKRWKKLIK